MDEKTKRKKLNWLKIIAQEENKRKKSSWSENIDEQETKREKLRRKIMEITTIVPDEEEKFPYVKLTAGEIEKIVREAEKIYKEK